MTSELRKILDAFGEQVSAYIEREAHARATRIEEVISSALRGVPGRPIRMRNRDGASEIPTSTRPQGLHVPLTAEQKKAIAAEVEAAPGARRAIYKRYGVSKTSVSRWRRGEGLRASGPGGHPVVNGRTATGRKIWSGDFKRQIVAKGAKMDYAARDAMFVDEGIASTAKIASITWHKWRAWVKKNPA